MSETVATFFVVLVAFAAIFVALAIAVAPIVEQFVGIAR